MEKNCTLQWFTSELLKQCLNPKKRAKLALIFQRMKRVVINGKERLISVQALFLLLQLRLHGLQFNSLLLTELFHCQRSTEVSHERERRQRWRCWGWHWNTGVGSVHSSLTPVASQLGPGALHGDQPWLQHCAQLSQPASSGQITFFLMPQFMLFLDRTQRSSHIHFATSFEIPITSKSAPQADSGQARPDSNATHRAVVC